MDELLRRTPAIAFDLAHAVELPDDSITNLSSNLEYSNLNESHMVRAAIGGFHLRYHSSLLHIIEALKRFGAEYDYAPYVPEPTPLSLANMSPPSDENLEALMFELPVRNFHISVQHPVFELHPGEHESRAQLPFLVIELEDLNMRMTDAFYPNRLIQTTCMIPEPPPTLLDACYVKYSADFARMSVHLSYKNELQMCHLKMTNAEVTMRMLLSPDLFDHNSVPRSVAGLNVECINLYMSNPQMVILHCLVDSIVKHAPIKPTVFDTTLIDDCKDASLPIVDISINRTIITHTELQPLMGVVGSVLNVIGIVYCPSSMAKVGYIESHKQKAIFLVDNQSFQEFIAVSLQLPQDLAGSFPKNNPPILALSVGQLQLNIDPLLQRFLSYKVRLLRGNSFFVNYDHYAQYDSNSGSTLNRSRITSRMLPTIPSVISRKSVTVPSVHSAEEVLSDNGSLLQLFPPQLKQPHIHLPPSPTTKIAFIDLYRLVKQVMVQVEIKEWTVLVPDRSLRMSQHDSKLKDIIASLPNLNLTVFRLPCINVRSSHEVNALQDVHKARPFPIYISKTMWTPKKDGFPWHLSMTGLEGSTLIAGNDYKFLTANRMAVTVMVSMRTVDKRQEPAFVIHMDTSPVVCSFSERQVLFLHRSLDSIRSLLALSYKFPDDLRVLDYKFIVEQPRSPFQSSKQQNLKDFMCTTDTVTEPTTTSEGTDATIKDLELEPAVPPAIANKHSIWLQWTLAKVTLRLFTSDNATLFNERKFILEMEDCITSFDQQDVYTKTKIKLGTLSGICLERPLSTEEWSKHDLVGVVTRNTMRNNSLEETFFELTITRALTKNVHGKWFTWKKKKRNPHLITTITEVMANVASVDVKLGPETLSSFVPLLRALLGNSAEKEMTAVSSPSRQFLSVSDLPLVFVKSQGIRIFVPLPTAAAADCNVLCMKIARVSIAPTAENPLVRKPLRSDIYSKAAELRILHVPGARVEDRQYEIVCENISMSSGKWEQIREQLEPSERVGLSSLHSK